MTYFVKSKANSHGATVVYMLYYFTWLIEEFRIKRAGSIILRNKKCPFEHVCTLYRS